MTPSSKPVGFLLQEFFRCPQPAAQCLVAADLSSVAGYFGAGNELVCYGRLSGASPAPAAGSLLPRAVAQLRKGGKEISLPFDPDEVIANLRCEKYVGDDGASSSNGGGLIRRTYYLLRPLLPVAVRKHLQRFSLRGWERIPFPRWPVDLTVERLYQWLLAGVMEAEGTSEVPFIWFWPDGRSSCAAITHDVETGAGRDFCGALMDINDSYGIKSSFQVVPEQRYEVPPEFLDCIRRRGFELNIHDLNHDGHLFSTREQFRERAKKINSYGKQFRARGFRSAVLYRRLEWMGELEFAYDMSVPNVAHLDPQHGGCCTVMPYFLGDRVEIPVTATQDYSLFHILREYSTSLWERQVAIISQAHGMASFIIHPDYVIERRARQTYEQLLQHLSGLRSTQDLWIALPGEINDWWRARAQMQLVRQDGSWRVEGKGSERARVAYARAEGDGVVYRVEKRANVRVSAVQSA